MTDTEFATLGGARLMRVLLPDLRLIAVALDATAVAREARRKHALAPSSAAMLGQTLTAGLLLAALQKAEGTHVNLQVECDGPARGLFADATAEGTVRGYIRHKEVRFAGGMRFDASQMLGRRGQLSVLREWDGQFYKGTVELLDADLGDDLNHYFATSEQVDTTVRVESLRLEPDLTEELGWVGGLLVQRLPDGDVRTVERWAEVLAAGRLEQLVRGGVTDPVELLTRVFEGHPFEVAEDRTPRFHCPCSLERVLQAFSTLPVAELHQMLAEDGKADVSCDFCSTSHVVDADLLRLVIAVVEGRAGTGPLS